MDRHYNYVLAQFYVLIAVALCSTFTIAFSTVTTNTACDPRCNHSILHCSRPSRQHLIIMHIKKFCGSGIKIPYIANHLRWKSFSFCRSISNHETFPVNNDNNDDPCNRIWPYKTTMQPQCFTVNLQFSFTTAKHFHLEQFAVYGIKL